VDWHASPQERLRLARLSARATDIRLRAPEAHRVHQGVIDWRRGSSMTGIPASAVGLARPTLGPMRWAMQSWARMERMNRFLGTGSAAAQLDYRPGLGSAAYFTLRPLQPVPEGEARIAALLRLGECVQRFWLTATRLGLALQPSYATLVFAHYGERSTRFTADEKLLVKAKLLAERFRQVLGAGSDRYVFMGRIGEPFPRRSADRSTRRPLPELLVPAPAREGVSGA
jgi:sulfur-carrier protein adenylyltransferase/sulfurtransferase